MGKPSQELKDRMIEWGSAMGSAVGFIELGKIFENRFCIGAIGLMAGIVVYVVVRHFNKEIRKLMENSLGNVIYKLDGERSRQICGFVWGE